jgi:hypothetical protein
MERSRSSGIVRTLRWLAVVPVALAIQALFALVSIQLVNANTRGPERLTELLGVGGLVCLAIASFVAGAVAPSRHALGALLGGGSILAFEFLSAFESMRNGSLDQDRGAAEVMVLGCIGIAIASALWFALDRTHTKSLTAGRTE